jgi:hypothetical protein
LLTLCLPIKDHAYTGEYSPSNRECRPQDIIVFSMMTELSAP